MDKNLVYCGLGVYADVDNGKLFEKNASGALLEIKSEKLSAEQRFINRHFDNTDLLDGEVKLNE